MPRSRKNSTSALTFFEFEESMELELPLIQAGISAGFPSPAMDFDENKIDLNRYLIKRPSSTFFARVKGNSMEGAGIFDGNLLVIDKSIKPKNDHIAVCFLDGEFTVKRIRIEQDCVWLIPENESFETRKVDSSNDFQIWGIVTYVIKSV